MGTPSQGSQFTANIFLEVLIEKQIGIAMDGKGRALDNVFIERFWRRLKQEKIYLRIQDHNRIQNFLSANRIIQSSD